MKSLFTKILFSALIITSFGSKAYSQGVWRNMTDLSTGRDFASTFVIGQDAYMCCGNSGNVTAVKDCWKYDPATDSWTQMADYGGNARWGVANFVVGDRAWLGTGRDGAANTYQDFYMYDAPSNTWTQKASFPGAARRGAVGFSVDDKGYVGCGWNGTNYYNDLYQYDTSADTWTSKSSVGGGGFNYPVAFSYKGKGYLGTGDNANNYNSDFYEYDPSNDTWTAKTSLSTGRYGAAAFVIGDYGYIACGYDGKKTLSDVNRYDFAKDTWDTVPANLHNLEMASGFSVGGKGYILGGDASYNSTTALKYLTQFDTMNLYTVVARGTTVCPNTSFDVWVSPTDTFDNGNTFTIQLSDSSGDFTNATTIGTLNDSIGGKVNCFIPKKTIAGTNYKVRTLSDMPVMAGSPSMISLQVNQLIKPTIIAPSSTTSCAGKPLSLVVDTFTSLGSKNNLLTLVYDATQGQSSLAGASKVYMHSGLADTTSIGTSWYNTVGNWGQDDSIGIMKSLGNNKWSITIDVTNYYSLNFMDNPKYIGINFRNEDGTSSGRDNSGLDIFVDIQTGIVSSVFSGVTGKWEASYQWLKDGSAISNATASKIGVAASGNYQFVSIGKNCPDTSSITTIVVGSLPTVGYEINSNTTQCYTGNTFFFKDTSSVVGGGAYNWTWDYGDGFSCQCVNPSHSYAAAGTYTITLTIVTKDGCVDSLKKQVTVLPSVHPWFTVNNYAQCIGGNLFILNDTATNTSGLTATINWDFGDGKTDTGVTTKHTYTKAGMYDISSFLSLPNGCKDTVTVSIEVFDGPTAKAAVDKSLQCIGGNIFKFTDNSTSTGGSTTRTWNFGDGNMDTAQNPQHSYTKTGQYAVWLKISTINGCMDSTVINVTVDSVPTVSIQALSTTTVCVGDSAKLQAFGKAGYNYQWSKNGNAISGATSDTYSTVDSGSYTVMVGSGTCSATSNAISIIVTPKKNLGAITGPITPIVNTTTTYSVANITSYTFNWTVTGGTIQTGQGTNQISVLWPNAVGTGTISVTGNCANASTLNVTIGNSGILEPTYTTISLYPNPANSMLFIDLNTIKTNGRIFIYDLSGKVIIEQPAIIGTNELNVANLPAGVYSIKVISNDKVMVGKFIKQ